MENKTEWELSLGLYPGILIGFRTYKEENQTTQGPKLSNLIKSGNVSFVSKNAGQTDGGGIQGKS